MTAREQYRQAYSLTRAYHAAAQGKDNGHIRPIARAFNALTQKSGIDWRFDHAARTSYLQRSATPGPSMRFVSAKIDLLISRV